MAPKMPTPQFDTADEDEKNWRNLWVWILFIVAIGWLTWNILNIHRMETWTEFAVGFLPPLPMGLVAYAFYKNHWSVTLLYLAICFAFTITALWVVYSQYEYNPILTVIICSAFVIGGYMFLSKFMYRVFDKKNDTPPSDDAE